MHAPIVNESEDVKMINIHEVIETNQMIEKENLDVRTITMGISLLDCADTNQIGRAHV